MCERPPWKVSRGSWPSPFISPPLRKKLGWNKIMFCYKITITLKIIFLIFFLEKLRFLSALPIIQIPFRIKKNKTWRSPLYFQFPCMLVCVHLAVRSLFLDSIIFGDFFFTMCNINFCQKLWEFVMIRHAILSCKVLVVLEFKVMAWKNCLDFTVRWDSFWYDFRYHQQNLPRVDQHASRISKIYCMKS